VYFSSVFSPQSSILCSGIENLSVSPVKNFRNFVMSTQDFVGGLERAPSCLSLVSPAMSVLVSLTRIYDGSAHCCSIKGKPLVCEPNARKLQIASRVLLFVMRFFSD
jgi:hypothetical protein